MNTVFARAILALGLVALPASALASTKTSAKHSHSVAQKDATPTTKKKGKHHAHKSSHKGLAATAKSNTAAKTAADPASEEAAPKNP